LVNNSDGSLDIYIQNTAPKGKESNWLPCPPSGLFRLNYRIYLPQEAARNAATLGKYLPPIKKVN
jgi:DNA sulfur modification protein DndE